MRRAFLLLLLSLLTLSISACDAAFFVNTGTIDGSVSQIRLTIINDGNGTSWQVTVVTLQTVNGPSELTVCGDQANRFPIDRTVSVRFTPGTPCASNVVVNVRS